MPEELIVSSSTDAAAAVEAVAQGEEARSEPQFVAEEMPGVTRESNSGAPARPVRALTFEHPQSSRIRVLQALDEAENELLESTEQVVSDELTEGQGEQAPEDIDIVEVRRVATADAIAEARRRNEYYAQQQAQHFSSPQAEINALRAELLPTFQAKLQAQITPADVEQLREGASIPLSHNPEVAARLLDCFVTLPGGVEASVYLMRNPAEVRHIASLPEHLAQARIVQLANRLDPSLQRKPSQAPPPIRPIGGSATTSAVDLANADYQTYKREREKQIKARRR